MNYQPGGVKPAPPLSAPLPPALLLLEVFAMKAQAQRRVSGFQLGLPMPWADMPQLGAGQRLCPQLYGREEGQTPIPPYPMLWPAKSAVSLQEAAVRPAKNMPMCTQSPRHRGLLWEWPESKWIWTSIIYPRPA